MKKNLFLFITLLLFAGAVDAQSVRTDITLEKTVPSSGFYDPVWDSIAAPRAYMNSTAINDIIYIGFDDADYLRYWRDLKYKYGYLKVAITTEENDTLYSHGDESGYVIQMNYTGIADGEYKLNVFYYGLWWEGKFMYTSHKPKGQYVYVDSTYYRLNEGTAVTVMPDMNGRTVTHRMLYDIFERDYPIHVVIPSELTYEGETYPVVGIGQRSFKGCYYMESISLPNTITHIDGGAFTACKKLDHIKIPESVTRIENCAFAECDRLSYMVIPEGITKLENHMFHDCRNLSAVTLPNSITSIEEMAFAGCTSLPWIDIPKNVTSIGDAAFQGCKNLMDVEFPKRLRKIGNYAFRGVQLLTSLEIPDGVMSIGEEAFVDMPDAAHIYCYANTPFTIYGKTFNFKCTLHVPYGCKEKYEKADIWKNFTHIEEMDEVHNNPEVMYGETGVSPVVRSEDAESPAFDLSGKPVDASHKGIVIRNGKKVMVR